MSRSKLQHIKIIQFKLILFIFIVFTALVYFQFTKIENEPMNLWSDHLPTGQCGIVLTGAPGRIREAFDYLAQKKIQKLIVSGVYKDSKLHEVFPYLPFYPEVNPEHIILEKKSETTYGNAKQSFFITENLKCTDIVLITSQIHMNRAYRMFRSTFPDRIEIKKLTLPNSKSEKRIWDLGLEIVKSLFYYILSLV